MCIIDFNIHFGFYGIIHKFDLAIKNFEAVDFGGSKGFEDLPEVIGIIFQLFGLCFASSETKRRTIKVHLTHNLPFEKRFPFNRYIYYRCKEEWRLLSRGGVYFVDVYRVHLISTAI